MRSMYGYPLPDRSVVKWERWDEFTDKVTGNLIIRYDLRFAGPLPPGKILPHGEKDRSVKIEVLAAGSHPVVEVPFVTHGLAVALTPEGVIEGLGISQCRDWLMSEISSPNIPVRHEGESPAFTAPRDAWLEANAKV